MSKVYEFKLTRPARSQGGDRYEYGRKGDKDFMVFYFPQEISRPNGTPLDALKVNIQTN